MKVKVNNGDGFFELDYGYTQTIRQPTRTKNSSGSLIDHVFVSDPETITQSFVAQYQISDHLPVCVTRKLSGVRKNKHETIRYRSMKTFQTELFLSDLQSVPWSTLESLTDPDDMLNLWIDLFLAVLDKHSPLKEKNVWVIPVNRNV